MFPGGIEKNPWHEMFQEILRDTILFHHHDFFVIT